MSLVADWKPNRDWIPDHSYETIQEVPWEQLIWPPGIKSGRRYLIWDCDNFVARKGENRAVYAAQEALKSARAAGMIDICLVSNVGIPGINDWRIKRVKSIAKTLDIEEDHVVCAFLRNPKPSAIPFVQACQIMGVPPENYSQVLVAGDQPRTDIQGGNRLGMTTIWVAPLDPKTDYPWTKWSRRLERGLKT